MIFPDINLLLYAYNKSAEQYERCATWLGSVMNGAEQVCFSWHTILGFIRISTTPNIFPNHYSSKEALGIAAELIFSSNSTMLLPGERHFAIFQRLINESGLSGSRISDAHIAALAIEHGATLASADRDFRVFDDLKVFNPLVDI